MSAPRDTVDVETVQASVAELVPLLAAAAEEADTNARLTSVAAKALREAGAHRLLQPAAFGGAEASITEHVRVAAKAAEGCVAAGWCVGLWSVHNWMVAHFSASTQGEVWADPAAYVSGSIVPRAPMVDDGPDHVSVSGRFGFASGSDHADWLLIGGRVSRGGDPEPAMGVVSRDEVVVDEDSWDVGGLRGSGSRDLVIDAPLRIPRDRLFFTEDSGCRTAPGQAVNTASLFRAPFHTIGILALAPPALGAARAALARFIDRMDDHVLMLRRVPQRNDQPARMRVAVAAAAIDAAERTMLAAAELCDAVGRASERNRLAEATIARDAAFAVRECARAVDLLYEASGGSALARREPLQRIWRDVHAIRSHAVLTWDAAGANYADALLGTELR